MILSRDMWLGIGTCTMMPWVESSLLRVSIFESTSFSLVFSGSRMTSDKSPIFFANFSFCFTYT